MAWARVMRGTSSMAKAVTPGLGIGRDLILGCIGREHADQHRAALSAISSTALAAVKRPLHLEHDVGIAEGRRRVGAIVAPAAA